MTVQVATDSFPDSLQIQLVQQQEGSYDCGLFAVAFAYHLAVGDDVQTLGLNQQKLRKHLFERKCLSRFPTQERKESSLGATSKTSTLMSSVHVVDLIVGGTCLHVIPAMHGVT